MEKNRYDNVEIAYILIIIGFTTACLYMFIEIIYNFITYINSMTQTEISSYFVYSFKTLVQVIIGFIASISFLKNKNAKIINYIFIALLLLSFKVNSLEYNSFPLSLALHIKINTIGLGINIVGLIPLIIFTKLEEFKPDNIQDIDVKQE